jgi:crotonobetainyl-CoA:carnitine CoA-transferase CaiB-like acyl-CoA transferase
MSGLGGTGPWRDYVSYADAVSALSGLTALALDGPHAAPVVHGLADIVAGHHAALATLAALAERRRSGLGAVIDLSELEAMAAQTGPGLLALTATGMPPAQGCGSPLAAPEGVYRCLGPDRWVAITVPDDAAWFALCGVIGSADLAGADRLASSAGRAACRAEIDSAISAWTAPRSAEDVAERLQSAGVPAGAVQDGRDLVEHDPQLRARQFYRVLTHPRAGPYLHEGIPIRLSATPGDLWDAAPLLGADTDGVLRTLGRFTPAEIATLQASGVLE